MTPFANLKNSIVIVADDRAYISKKQDKSLAGEKTAAENTADKERLNVDALQWSFTPVQITAMQKAVGFMAKNVLRNKKIQESDNDAVIIEKMLSNVIRSRDGYLVAYEYTEQAGRSIRPTCILAKVS